ncbi:MULTISPECIES: hypothetical protein [unclassified Pseudomonas]|uniref:hypothetical protein n=1 Tax=unclassified Pseudomonas TaxID=196821 RepID=UPI00244C516A|nr:MULTISPECIES: hypothetical protein [unclassified Pseudomonas]MDG9930432.1 hypothetical protein [Pseudomonas sp. GD04042]MDH0483018.1 hypothetical protein [Pseudomonas sp. GD04015]MDH0605418.1 hypothetical protein [Pseudomonas sp. GD03869]
MPASLLQIKIAPAFQAPIQFTVLIQENSDAQVDVSSTNNKTLFALSARQANNFLSLARTAIQDARQPKACIDGISIEILIEDDTQPPQQATICPPRRNSQCSELVELLTAEALQNLKDQQLTQLLSSMREYFY